MGSKTIEDINAEIVVLKDELEQVKGTPTEVYTRIVGYFRAVDNWNRGKREEYKDRRTFIVNQGKIEEKSLFSSNIDSSSDDRIEETNEKKLDLNNILSYKLFTSRFCRNCPPVKEFFNNISLSGEELDVSTDLGINASRKYDIMSTPTVVFFDDNENIIEKAYSVEDLEKIFTKAAIA